MSTHKFVFAVFMAMFVSQVHCHVGFHASECNRQCPLKYVGGSECQATFNNSFDPGCININTVLRAGKFRDSKIDCRSPISHIKAAQVCLPRFKVDMSHIDSATFAFRLRTEFRPHNEASSCKAYSGYPAFLGESYADPENIGKGSLVACLRAKVLYSSRMVRFRGHKIGRNENHFLVLANLESKPFLTAISRGQAFIGDTHQLHIENMEDAQDVRLELVVGRGACGAWPSDPDSKAVQRTLVCSTQRRPNNRRPGSIFIRQLGPPIIAKEGEQNGPGVSITISRMFGSAVLQEQRKGDVFVKEPKALQVDRNGELAFSLRLKLTSHGKHHNCTCCFATSCRLQSGASLGGVSFTIGCNCSITRESLRQLCHRHIIIVEATNAWGTSPPRSFSGKSLFRDCREVERQW